MLIASLALRDLLRDRLFLICNVAVMVGVLVPLLLLIGVKNGVYGALIGEMLADPVNLQIDTAGNASFTADDLAALDGWPDIAFVTPKVRGQFDYMTVRAPDGRRMRPALVVPSGPGDPTLPTGMEVAGDAVVLSAQLAAQLGLGPGDAVQLVSQAEGRPRQLVLAMRVAGVLPDRALAGRAVLAPFATLDLIEAFYESYSLPEHGIVGTRDLVDRVPTFEGVRLFARRLEDVAGLQARIEAALGVTTTARTRDIEALLGLGRNLNLALGLTAVLAALGMGAALVFGFWSEVARKRPVLAGLALLGLPGARLALFPMAQAAVTAALGLGLSLALYLVAGQAAAALFGQGLPQGAPLTVLPMTQGLAICAAVLALVLGAAGAAAWSVQRLDPARALREAT